MATVDGLVTNREMPVVEIEVDVNCAPWFGDRVTLIWGSDRATLDMLRADVAELERENDVLRAELADLRAKHAELVAHHREHHNGIAAGNEAYLAALEQQMGEDSDDLQA